eukprot:gi/632988622/ref/XP_007883212.1/ PREDICTED: protein FAM178A-like [Callorhinchus milii]
MTRSPSLSNGHFSPLYCLSSKHCALFFQNHLIQLCTQIEKHIKCDIREDPKLLYRSKVKDLEARTYVKWQELLQRSRPLQGKLHDYWEPVCEEITQSSVVEELKASDGNNAVEAEHYTERDTK